MRVCRRCGAIYLGGANFCGLDGERLVVADQDPLVGTTLDRYQIKSLLGGGGMARVYRAEHRHLAQPVAIKVLLGDVASDPRFADRFVREARAAAQIRHPNVVEVRDFGVASCGLSFMAMELLEGPTLAEYRRNRQPGVAEIARIVRQTSLGLAAAHRLGFVHRDLKPKNLMLVGQEPDLQVKILDFGLVHLLETGGDRLTVLGQVLGSPAYMAPEQIIDGPIDARTDLYALGIILYELLCGRKPFGGDRAELWGKHLGAWPADLEDSSGLGSLARALMSKSPSDRPATAEVVVEALDAMGFEGAGARPKAIPRPVSRPKEAREEVKNEAKEEIDDGQLEAMAAALKSVWPSRVLLMALGFAAISLFYPLYAARSVDAAERLVHIASCAVLASPPSDTGPSPASLVSLVTAAPAPKILAASKLVPEPRLKSARSGSAPPKSKLLPRLPAKSRLLPRLVRPAPPPEAGAGGEDDQDELEYLPPVAEVDLPPLLLPLSSAVRETSTSTVSLLESPPQPTRVLYRWPSSSLSVTLAGAQETLLPIELG